MEVAVSAEKGISKLYEIVQEMDDTADIQIVMRKHLVQSKPQGNKICFRSTTHFTPKDGLGLYMSTLHKY